MTNYSQAEIDKFNNLASSWWDQDGELKTLHHINPCRLEFIKKHVNLSHKQTIDIGCGGGILSEGLAQANAQVTAIDLAPQSIEIAKLHLYESNLNIDYQCIEIGEFAKNNSNSFDVLTCMEMLEHVPDPEYIINHCASLLKVNGIAFFSTLNKSIKSYLLGIIAAEYILNLVPRGTHEYNKFITPSQLRMLLVKHNLELIDIKGMQYNPFTHQATLNNDTGINYLVACRKIC